MRSPLKSNQSNKVCPHCYHSLSILSVGILSVGINTSQTSSAFNAIEFVISNDLFGRTVVRDNFWSSD